MVRVETLLLTYDSLTTSVGRKTENMNGQDCSRERRSRFSVIGEILQVAIQGVSKTRIMCRANLSTLMMNEYIELLERLNLVEALSEKGRTIYKTNEKGFQFLQNYRQILEILGDRDGNIIQSNIKGGPFTYWIEKTPPADPF
jgi:predicted transcriptional regulator